MRKLKNAKSLKEKRTCPQCTKTFVVDLSLWGQKRKKFCSHSCSTKMRQKEKRDEINAYHRKRRRENPNATKLATQAMNRWKAKQDPEKLRNYNRKRYGTGEIPDPNDVIFYGYKEPLRKFEGGHGYIGVLCYNKDQDKVQCHFCGRMFKSINNGHLMKAHGLTAHEYKKQTGLSQQTALVGEGTREKLLKRGHNPNHIGELKKAHKKRMLRKKQGLPDIQSGHKLAMEIYNKRGTCPDQLLHKIELTIKSFGRVPTAEEFLGFHHGKYMGSIRKTFGGWTEALAKLGHKTTINQHTKESLLDAMKTFYEVNKRTPKWSDMQRGLLPDAKRYYHRFKSLNQARLEAGVPLVVPMGRRNEYQEWQPTKKEREKLLAKRTEVGRTAFSHEKENLR